jgi:disulfide bond formation protein DsbB
LTTETVSRFLAMLAVVAELATFTAIVLVVGSRLSPKLRIVGRRAVETLAPSALPLAAVVAAVAMAGSLYYSEVANFPPCVLCWYQRIAMYPLVLLLGLGAFRRDAGVALYGAVIAGVGAPISIYHILVERGIVKESIACDPDNPCSLIWVKEFGYLTIPTMALSGFLLISLLLLISHRSEVHGHH